MSVVKRTVGVVGDQFYVTHCATADSVRNDPGYAVRAASTTDAEALAAALRSPAYELPIDLWKVLPAKAQTPRRLARTAHPHGGACIAHSVYLEQDTVGRHRSYFTHLLHLPNSAAGPAAVLKSWDARGWVKEYPAGAPKTLPRSGLPVGRAISRPLLLAFLTRPKAGVADLSSGACPARLHADVSARRDLVARFLHALALVIVEKAKGGPRDRLFVHAEPGLVAMLLYAAARILPPHFTADLTFSTFEPAHRDIRAYTLATVIGTFIGAPGKGLDPALATERGYTLDALELGRSSPELSEWVGVPDGIATLVGLAADGEWDRLAKVRRRVGTGTNALDRVARAIESGRAAPKPATAPPKAAVPVAASGPAPLVAEPPATGSASTQPMGSPPRSATRTKLLWAAAVVGCVLPLAFVAFVLRSPKRGTEAAKIESPIALVDAATPANADGVKASGTNLMPPLTPTEPLPPTTLGPMKPPDPPPAVGPPPPTETAVLTETVRLLARRQLYQTYLNIELLADARAKRLNKAAESALMLASVVVPLEQVEQQLEQVAALKSLPVGDAAAVARMRKTAGLLRAEGKALQSFWDTGDADDGKKYEEASRAVWTELSGLLEFEPK